MGTGFTLERMSNFEIADTTRLSRPSLAQVKAVVEFIQKHPNLAHRGLRNGVKNENIQNLWTELANIVNSIKGAVKTTKGWIKFWSDKKRNIMMKQKQINSGEIVGKLTSLEQKILAIAKLRKKKSQKPQLCNGNDDSGDDNPEDDNNLDLQIDTDEMLPSEAEHLNIMAKMIDAMDEQAIALTKMAQATVIKSKAMERMAETSYKQALAVDRLAGTFETIDAYVYDVRNAVISIDYTIKKCFTANSTQHRQNILFS
ncbi:uncharacterized protein LOC123877646 [Maniola jurtina]|uniref:uncharacterized protein LOC123877646 n=1 Tax=Maniola jurtina TaxID=191418 RepID=UPI001E687D44|nr:uncharacterized protein LOC123877646 [Maniola jurtina]